MKSLLHSFLRGACLSAAWWAGAAAALPACPTVGYYHQCLGKESWPTGNQYVGEYKNNKKHGQGTYTASNGDQYVGAFKDGTYNGVGVYTFANGNRYTGDFVDGRRTGQGVFVRKDVQVIVGEWLDDQAHGRLIEFAADGSIQRSGIYEKGRLRVLQPLTLDLFPRLAQDSTVQAIRAAQAQAAEQLAAQAAAIAAAAAEKAAAEEAKAKADALALAERQAEQERLAEQVRQAAAAETLAVEQAKAQAQREAEAASAARAAQATLAAAEQAAAASAPPQAVAQAQLPAAGEAAAAPVADQAQADLAAKDAVARAANAAPPKAVAAATAPAIPTVKDCADCPDMAFLPAGSVTMKADKSTDDKAAATVQVRSFLLAKTEVTQRQWKSLMGDNPSRFTACGLDCPVDNVSWKEVTQFIRKLNQKAGQSYRLPSEAEWEYAAKAGAANDLLFSDNASRLADYAWFIANSQKSSHPVASKKPNAFGLFDMYGNVWEWVDDCYHDNFAGLPLDGSPWISACTAPQRVLRGGSWSDDTASLRNRGRYAPEVRNLITGFRLARSL